MLNAVNLLPTILTKPKWHIFLDANSCNRRHATAEILKIETDATFSCQTQDVVNTRSRALAVNYMFFDVVVLLVLIYLIISMIWL